MRICLIGYGYWGKNLARVFGKDLVAICDNDQNNLNKAKKLYDVKYFSDKDVNLFFKNTKIKLVCRSGSDQITSRRSCCYFFDHDCWRYHRLFHTVGICCAFQSYNR